MILEVKITKDGSEWKVTNKNDQLHRWSGTVRMSDDMNDLICECTQARKYLHCTHESQVREYLQLNDWKFEEFKSRL